MRGMFKYGNSNWKANKWKGKVDAALLFYLFSFFFGHTKEAPIFFHFSLGFPLPRKYYNKHLNMLWMNNVFIFHFG